MREGITGIESDGGMLASAQYRIMLSYETVNLECNNALNSFASPIRADTLAKL